MNKLSKDCTFVISNSNFSRSIRFFVRRSSNSTWRALFSFFRSSRPMRSSLRSSSCSMRNSSRSPCRKRTERGPVIFDQRRNNVCGVKRLVTQKERKAPLVDDGHMAHLLGDYQPTRPFRRGR